MKPIDQTRFAFKEPLQEPPGNCWAACICSILEVELDQFPDEADYWKSGMTNEESWDQYYPHALNWIQNLGYNLLDVKKSDIYSRGKFDSYCILSGPSPRDNSVNHAVVGLGFNIVHDPHHSRAGLDGDPKDWWVEIFVSKNPRIIQVENTLIDTCPVTGELNCTKCSGEYCETHFNKPCDCDVIERHCYN